MIVQMRGLLSCCQCMIIYSQKGAFNIVCVVAFSCMTCIVMSLLLKETSCKSIRVD